MCVWPCVHLSVLFRIIHLHVSLHHFRCLLFSVFITPVFDVVDVNMFIQFFMFVCPSLHLRYALGFILALIVSNVLFVHSPPALLFVYAGPVLPYATCTNNYAR